MIHVLSRIESLQGLAINNVVGISQRTEFGENDSTSFVLSEEYNVSSAPEWVYLRSITACPVFKLRHRHQSE